MTQKNRVRHVLIFDTVGKAVNTFLKSTKSSTAPFCCYNRNYSSVRAAYFVLTIVEESARFFAIFFEASHEETGARYINYLFRRLEF